MNWRIFHLRMKKKINRSLNNLIQYMKTFKHKVKNFALVKGFLMLPVMAMSQDVAVETKENPLAKVPEIFFEPTFYLWLLILSILVGVFIAMSRAIRVLGFVINKNVPDEKEEESTEKVAKESSWMRLMHAMTRSVPVEQEADVMLDHDYDGIRELDNKLPPWWVWGFYLTIVFAFVYLIHYHVSGSGSLQLEEYNHEMRTAELEKENRMKTDANFVTESNVVASADPMALSEGQNIYKKDCVACHGNAGQGGVGPNLTDDFWLHGGGIKNVFRVITNGVPDKGMISWKSQLSPKQIQSVSSFILSMHGTNPPDPKDPQGEKWTEPIISAGVDSTTKVN